MKKVFLVVILTILSFSNTKAQGIDFGVTGGLLNADANLDVSIVGIDLGSIADINKTGFYIGAFVDIWAIDKLHVQPEFLYSKAGDLEFFFVPIVAKYYVVEKFNIQFGPQLSFSSNLKDIKNAISDVEDLIGSEINADEVLNTTGVDLAFGAGFEITEKISVQARYAIEITDRYSGPLGGSIDIKPNMLFAGIGFKF